jgi:hypothetical protein
MTGLRWRKSSLANEHRAAQPQTYRMMRTKLAAPAVQRNNPGVSIKALRNLVMVVAPCSGSSAQISLANWLIAVNGNRLQEALPGSKSNANLYCEQEQTLKADYPENLH